MSNNRYRLTVCVEYTSHDDPTARLAVTRNMDVLSEVATALHGCVGGVGQVTAQARVKLQRLNDDTPPRALLVETL